MASARGASAKNATTAATNESARATRVDEGRLGIELEPAVGRVEGGSDRAEKRGSRMTFERVSEGAHGQCPCIETMSRDHALRESARARPFGLECRPRACMDDRERPERFWASCRARVSSLAGGGLRDG